MSSTSAEDVSAALEPKLEDSGDYKGLQDIDMDKPVLHVTPAEDVPASQNLSAQAGVILVRCYCLHVCNMLIYFPT